MKHHQTHWAGRKPFFRSAVAAIALAGSIVLPLQATAADPSIHPFKFTASAQQLSGLRERIRETRWPEKETVSDSSQGVQLEKIRALAKYWAGDYDWRRIESKLNSYPQFTT